MSNLMKVFNEAVTSFSVEEPPVMSGTDELPVKPAPFTFDFDEMAKNPQELRNLGRQFMDFWVARGDSNRRVKTNLNTLTNLIESGANSRYNQIFFASES